ncbi:hypothetical protein J2128_000082 [Methanomicrobium sp. W14]|nr:hypothetical protein [Methanomicrobium sp. W14]MBP2132161.1 hypothetical protein [Methanomicrobium sp. W14]
MTTSLKNEKTRLPHDKFIAEIKKEKSPSEMITVYLNEETDDEKNVYIAH